MNNKIVSKLGRRGLVIIAILCCVMVASATIIEYYREVNVSLDIPQGVLLNGGDWTEPLNIEMEINPGCTECIELTVESNGCEGVWLGFEFSAVPDPEGITIRYKQAPILSEACIYALDGIADDSFEVYIDDIHIYTYIDEEPINDPEEWSWHNINIEQFEIHACDPHTMTIVALGEPWDLFETYGQLGISEAYIIDSIGGTDSVDIGDPLSEDGHNLQGWGSIEPLTHGGGWGGIDNCRVVWFYPDDEPWASIDFQIECECSCDWDEIEMPFYLEPWEVKQLCICIHPEMYVRPGHYNLRFRLIYAPM